MSVLIGSAANYADLLNQLDSFLTGSGMALVPTFVGIGTGTISALGGSAGVAETITVTFTSPTAFNVAGSVSGALGAGVVGTTFVSTKVKLTVTAGGTAFVSGDAFTFAVTPPWTSLLRTAGVEMIWQAPGNGGLDEIIVGAQIFSNVGADYYNWRLGGFQGFDSGVPFNQQPGYVGGPSQTSPSPVLPLWNSTIPFWFIANGRRVIVIAKISTVYVGCYLGLMAPYVSPGGFPYPLIVAGSLAFGNNTEPVATSTNWRWSYAGPEMRAFTIPQPTGLVYDSDSVLRLRLPSGAWRGFCSIATEASRGKVWPYGWTDPVAWDWRPNLDGGYSLFPVVLCDCTPNVYGELDGVKAVTGFAQSAENTVTVDGVEYLVVQNVFRTTKSDYFAVQLS
jgi:hypothetical protein